MLGLSLFAVGMAAVIGQAAPEYETTQAMVRAAVAEHLGPERADRLPTGIQQIWLPERNRVDRCVTCHATATFASGMEDAPVPARSHSHPELLKAHPPEKFGCTLCHGGQGWATTQDAAHGDVEYWDDPLLDSRRAKRYGLSMAQLLEMKCAVCHREEDPGLARPQEKRLRAIETLLSGLEGEAGRPLREALQAEYATLDKTPGEPAMPFLAQARKIVLETKRCSRCHVINGEGGSEGPDLTYEGDKAPEHYTFPDGWRRSRTALTWHIEHLRDPDGIVKGSTMKTGKLTDDERLAIALLILSWRRP